MKTIVIIGTSKEHNFEESLFNYLKIFNLNLKIIEQKDLKLVKHVDYTIINSKNYLSNLQVNCSYCFVNMDYFHKDIQIHGNIITYGLGNKNTVTVSSMEKEKGSFVYCIQRYLNPNSLGVLEPQEIPINMQYRNINEIYALMITITLALINKIDYSKILKKSNKNFVIENKIEY